MNEKILLHDIWKKFSGESAAFRRAVKVGVGDDAALVRVGGTDVAMTVDSIVDGVDFDLRYFGWADVGYKALSAAVSDLYACGAEPSAFLVTAGIPKGVKRAQTAALLKGLAESAAVHRAPIVGGDITLSPKLFLDVCAVGRCAGTFKSRAGARPGDFIFLSGPVGTSRAALLSFQRRKPVAPALRRAHLRPAADRKAGLHLGRERSVTAMMDISDGLLIDLSRLCEASRVSAGIYPNQIPVSPAAKKAFRAIGKNPREEAAIGGEDFVLLFTVRPPIPESISAAYRCIGRILPKQPRGGPIYNMERRSINSIKVKGFLHQF